jgi:hypothetical protein
VVILAWHVDYWDYIGWKDPYGSPKFSKRQSEYTKAWKAKQRWTPQFVVNNKVEKGNTVAQAIADSAGKGDAALTISGSFTADDNAISGTVTLATASDDVSFTEDHKVIPVLVQKKATTEVNAGENRGKSLVEYYVVLEMADPVSAEAALKGREVKFAWPSEVKTDNLSVAILVEDTKAMKTLECRSFSVGE